MSSHGQRVWSRVEAPGTARGHALVARFGGSQWKLWENADGTWNVQYGDAGSILADDWTTARGIAERWRTRLPPVSNPLNPYVANAAAAGSAIALRAHLVPNPQTMAVDRHREVCRLIPAGWLAGGCELLSSGVTRVSVHRGCREMTLRALRATPLPFAVEVVER